jgi:hypothetical protein
MFQHYLKIQAMSQLILLLWLASEYKWHDKGWIVCKLNENGYTFDGYSHCESTREVKIHQTLLKKFKTIKLFFYFSFSDG